MEVFSQVYSPIEVNTYFLADESGDCVIIDCGCYNTGEFSSLVKFVESRGLNPVLLLTTHCHLDHIFGNRFILEKYNLRTSYHRLEESNRKNAPKHADFFGLTMGSQPDPGGYIEHDQIIHSGEISLRALHVPGHSPGSLAFYSEKEGAVFTGDALFSGSIGRTDLPGGDYQTLIKSIQTNLLNLPDATKVFPGHGPETSIGQEIKSNPYLI